MEKLTDKWMDHFLQRKWREYNSVDVADCLRCGGMVNGRPWLPTFHVMCIIESMDVFLIGVWNGT